MLALFTSTGKVAKEKKQVLQSKILNSMLQKALSNNDLVITVITLLYGWVV